MVGGGFSGTTLAARLLQSDSSVEVQLYEKTGQIGAGLAYSTNDPGHLLNVPAARMSAVAGDPGHFAKWLLANRIPGAADPDRAFIPRLHYRRYLQDLLEAAGGEIHRIGSEVTSLDDLPGVIVVLATGYPPESNLRLSGAYAPFAPETWPTKSAQVVIVGSGLTAADAALTAAARYPSARIVIISRSGALPETYDPEASHPHLTYSGGASVREITRWLKIQSRTDDWQSVFNAMRPQWEGLWQSLPLHEQARFLKRLRSWFDRRRHRMPPATAKALAGAKVEVSHQTVIGLENGTVTCASEGRETILEADLVIDCTGQSLSWASSRDPLYLDLFARGARPGPHGLGIEVDGLGRVAGLDRPVYAIGPMRRGSNWETTAVAELRQQVAEVAQKVVDQR